MQGTAAYTQAHRCLDGLRGGGRAPPPPCARVRTHHDQGASSIVLSFVIGIDHRRGFEWAAHTRGATQLPSAEVHCACLVNTSRHCVHNAT